MGNCFSHTNESKRPSAIPEPLCLSKKDIAGVPSQKHRDRDHGKMFWKDLISADRTSGTTNSLTCGIATCPPKRGSPSLDGHHALHTHPQAVVYIFQHGEGIVNIEMLEHEVSQGSVVYVPGGAEHGIRNVDPTEELIWYFCFAVDTHGDVRYRYKNDGYSAPLYSSQRA